VKNRYGHHEHTDFVAEITYGSEKRPWHPDFIGFIQEMAAHAVYAGMPDAIDEDGKVQWESPSNRRSGKYQNTHAKRLKWWMGKAECIGISTEENQWISRVAKRIHPLKRKPCRNCGRWLHLDYRYPNKTAMKKFREIFEGLEFSELTSILEVVDLVHSEYGVDGLKQLVEVLSAPSAPDFPQNAADSPTLLKVFLLDIYIPAEVKGKLGPGAMSNAPDRFDGFHHFNRCCRGRSDPGRSKKNLSTYSTDRRVFEHWCGGDWIAADRLMGQFPSAFTDHECRIEGCFENILTADHIGPVSLGFAHRPSFGLMCKSDNSSKNNRMSLFDIEKLRAHINEGEEVFSWQSRHVWDALHHRVNDEETARRLSKVMRDNQRIAMEILCQLKGHGCLAYLATFLELGHARCDVEFVGLSAVDGVTHFDAIKHKPRTSKQVEKQMERRLRVAFKSLDEYAEKENRHAWTIQDTWTIEIEAMVALLKAGRTTRTVEVDRRLEEFLTGGRVRKDSLFSDIEIATEYPPKGFSEATDTLQSSLKVIADSLAKEWDSDRYIRTGLEG